MASLPTISVPARQKFGLLVRTKRSQHNQIDFSKGLGISQSSLSKIEQGSGTFPERTLRDVASKLGLEDVLREAAKVPPANFGFCENPDCPSVTIEYGGDDILFIPKIFRVEERDEIKGKCPLGHSLNTMCKNCSSPINPNCTHLCNNPDCGERIIGREEIMRARFGAGILTQWDSLEEQRASTLFARPSPELWKKTQELLGLIEKENQRRKQLLSRVSGDA